MSSFKPDINSNKIGHLFRVQSGKMSAILTRIFGFQNFELIEDIVQETFLTAIKTWSIKGEPENPEAWLMMVAKNKIINELKQRKLHSNKREKIHYEQAKEEIDELFLDHEIKDSQLRILFACCHQDLKTKAQIMLTLKILSGFSDKEIANALLMKESAVRKEIYRAKEILKSRYSSLGIPYLPQVYERIDTVLTIVYLMFNEGYKTTNSDEVINEELCYESVRITYLILQTNYTDKGKIYALLSLMYFNLARYSSRVNDNGELINLEFQDRSKWDKAQIIKGFFYLKKSRESKEFSRYHLESTIASFHCSAPTFEKTDWKGILDCYKKLLEKEDSIIVNLNYAIALGWAEGFEIGLNALKEIVPDSKYNRSFYLNVAIAEMNFQLTRYEIAKSYYQVALDQTLSMVDKTFIIEKIMNCDKKNFSSN